MSDCFWKIYFMNCFLPVWMLLLFCIAPPCCKYLNHNLSNRSINFEFIDAAPLEWNCPYGYWFGGHGYWREVWHISGLVYGSYLPSVGFFYSSMWLTLTFWLAGLHINGDCLNMFYMYRVSYVRCSCIWLYVWCLITLLRQDDTAEFSWCITLFELVFPVN